MISNGTMAIRNVIISIRKICSVCGKKAMSPAPIIGLILKINPELKKFIPFIRLRFSFGTIIGTKDETAGCWNANEAARSVFIVRIIGAYWISSRNIIKSKNVNIACIESDIKIITFLFHLSAITPENGVTMTWGRNIRNTERDKKITSPAKYHVITNPTIIEPNIENCWPNRNNK